MCPPRVRRPGEGVRSGPVRSGVSAGLGNTVPAAVPPRAWPGRVPAGAVRVGAMPGLGQGRSLGCKPGLGNVVPAA
ncbi:hypothetical protein GCM10022245_69620 [Streptomyces mayteni]